MRIAILGDGFIGAALAARVLEGQGGLELCALLSRSGRAAHIAPELRVSDIAAVLQRRPQLVIEAAHPALSTKWGARILACCDYLPLSLSALADARVHEALLGASRTAGTRLLIAHGAVVGLDSLLEWRAQWKRVRIRFRKHPGHIDFAASGLAPPAGDGASLVFAGSVRKMAQRFPRNVNAMVACALATTGLDSCVGELHADHALTHAVLEIDAMGADGSRLAIRRRQPMLGVSGSEMAESAWRSLQLACGQRSSLAFV